MIHIVIKIIIDHDQKMAVMMILMTTVLMIDAGLTMLAAKDGCNNGSGHG